MARDLKLVSELVLPLTSKFPPYNTAILTCYTWTLVTMPPAGRRIGDDFVDDSDSDLSITGLDDDNTRAKGKGKGKAIERKKKDKGKGKAKEVRALASPRMPGGDVRRSGVVVTRTGQGPARFFRGVVCILSGWHAEASYVW